LYVLPSGNRGVARVEYEHVVALVLVILSERRHCCHREVAVLVLGGLHLVVVAVGFVGVDDSEEGLCPSSLVAAVALTVA
jgi:hypothetical protein